VTAPRSAVDAILDDPWLNTEQAAAYTGRSKVTIWRHASANTLKSTQAGRGRGRRYKRADLDRWLEEAPSLPHA
jgi:excisionase family DNA binding protein